MPTAIQRSSFCTRWRAFCCEGCGMRLTPCSCPAAGWCERHRQEKGLHEFHLCRRNQDAFDAWERDSQRNESASVGKGPSLVRRAWNFSSAVVRHAADGMRHVSDEVFEVRLAICRTCASCDVEQFVCRELACGCNLQVKARWASESCPRRLWLSEVEPAKHELSP